MAKGTSDYIKPKKQTIKELDEAIGETTPAPSPPPKPKPAPKPKKQWWER